MNQHHANTGLLASSTALAGSSVGWAFQQLYLHGPSWELVAPILAALAALITAYASSRKTLATVLQEREKHAQQLRHEEELHQARLAQINAGRS